MNEETSVKRPVLVVDDNAQYRVMLTRFMRSMGFECYTAEDGVHALEVLAAHPDVELIMSDLEMPRMNGLVLLGHLREQFPAAAVMMITGVGDLDVAVRCLGMGAMDYVSKPFHIGELRARVGQVLERRRLVAEEARLLEENRAHQQVLEQTVAAQARRLESVFRASMESLADALEAKDAYTHGHSQRVSQYATILAEVLGCDGETVHAIELGGRLHDVGKIGVREGVLNKAAKLTDEEYLHIMTHPLVGARILGPLLDQSPVALNVVRSHHERFDGRGVPDRLTGAAIPIEARIVAAADAFDAMTSERPYRRAGLAWEDAIEEMRRGRGTQFDPDVVDAFLEAITTGRITRSPNHPAASETFESLVTRMLAEVGERTGLEYVMLAVHRMESDMAEERFAWKPHGSSKGGSAEECTDVRVRVPWSASLIREFLERGIRSSAHLHRDFPRTLAAQTTGYETFLSIPLGSLTDVDLFLVGASRESMVLTTSCLCAVEALAQLFASQALTHPGAASALAQRAQVSRPTIAIIDDDPLMRLFAEAVLSGTYTVVAFDNGKSALDEFRRVLPDVVLLDIEMPDMSGYDVLKLIREDSRLQALPVIAFSALASEPMAFIRAGFDGAIHKSSGSAQLIASSVSLFVNGHARNVRPDFSAFDHGWEAIEARSALARQRVLAAEQEYNPAPHVTRHPEIVHTAQEFVAARDYARTLKQGGVNRPEALTAFRQIHGTHPASDRTLAERLARVEATCIEAYDAE
jgi:putative two-component system response regulator